MASISNTKLFPTETTEKLQRCGFFYWAITTEGPKRQQYRCNLYRECDRCLQTKVGEIADMFRDFMVANPHLHPVREWYEEDDTFRKRKRHLSYKKYGWFAFPRKRGRGGLIVVFSHRRPNYGWARELDRIVENLPQWIRMGAQGRYMRGSKYFYRPVKSRRRPGKVVHTPVVSTDAPLKWQEVLLQQAWKTAITQFGRWPERVCELIQLLQIITDKYCALLQENGFTIFCIKLSKYTINIKNSIWTKCKEAGRILFLPGEPSPGW